MPIFEGYGAFNASFPVYSNKIGGLISWIFIIPYNMQKFLDNINFPVNFTGKALKEGQQKGTLLWLCFTL